MLNRSCLPFAVILFLIASPRPDAHAVDMTSGTGQILGSVTSVPTLSSAGDLVVSGGKLSVRAACDPNGADRDCDVSISDRCAAKKLKAAARYSQKVMQAKSAELRGAPEEKVARKLSRARARLQRTWNSAEGAAARAGESCSETIQNFRSVAAEIDAAASSYADLASSNLDTEQRSGRSCASGRIRSAARLWGGLLLAEQKYYAAGTQNNPELAVLATAEGKVLRRFAKNWSRLPRQCGTTEIGEASENVVMSLAENTRLQVTSPDTDGDGLSDALDLDDDGDTWTDAAEESCNTDPLAQNSFPSDSDNDMTCDLVDSDDDGDGIPDGADSFPLDASETTDTDGDGTGDNADTDDDGDSWSDSDEAACDTEALNSESIPTDTDGDLVCDVLDTDDDGDGIPDGADSFPLDASETTDTDGDGTGNNADTDDDGDSWSDSHEAACDTEALNSESIPTDTDGDLVCDVLDTDDDGDGIPDGADSFPLDASETTDTDSDGTGDNADTDDDGDSWSDSDEAACDTEALNSESIPTDTDGDLVCDVLDTDDDGDGIPDGADSFPLDASETTDTDGDGTGNNADTDDDGDSWSDSHEAACDTEALNSESIPTDTDGDLVCDVLDTDDDGDGIPDGADSFPLDASETTDTDGDGTGDNADTDDDGDSWSDSDEAACDTEALNSESIPTDTDGDLVCDVLDTDDDGDGIPDGADSFPLDASETTDTDGDGTGNNADTDDDGDSWSDSHEAACDTEALNSESIPTDTDGDLVCDVLDTDDDGDGIPDGADSFPLDASETTDTDSDGTGDNADTDDDGDSWSDSDEAACDTEALNSESIPTDTDGDLVCDVLDTDDDGDGIPDGADSFPLDASETTDTDGDGTGDNADTDDDGDSWSDSDEAACDTEALNSESIPTDTDGDLVCDVLDTDDDGDGIPDGADSFPLDASETTDTDGDGTGNNADTDDDGDSWSDSHEAACDTEALNSESIPTDTDGDLVCDVLDTDDDGDGIPDGADSFPLDASETTDTDGDGTGDNADICPNDASDDLDGDGVCGDVDNCPAVVNANQADQDQDTQGDACDTDIDGDGVLNTSDNCPLVVNADQADSGGTSAGDVCENDSDGDGVDDVEDNCVSDPNTNQADQDMDTEGDACDADIDGDGTANTSDSSPLDASETTDTDGDGTGNNADTDDDGDSWSDSDEAACDTEALNSESIPTDTDGDLVCDVLDTDDDGDGIPDGADSFPLDASETTDTDGDGTGDNADTDDDGDSWSDSDEAACDTEALNSESIPTDTDGDLVCDVLDTDDDGDGIPDGADSFPLDASETTDTDSDGTGDNADTDDDGDSWSDSDEAACDTEALNSESIPTDTDGDLVCDVLDTDDDGDGIPDGADSFPLDASETTDTDGDGTGDNADTDDDGDSWSDSDEAACDTEALNSESIPTDTDGDLVCDVLDTDDDGDGIPDGADSFPLDASETTDTDGDGTGDNADTDDDGDSWSDSHEAACDTEALNSESIPTDTDGDLVCDVLDTDDDGDGIPDGADSFPLDASETTDTDSDGTGDNADTDDDGDSWSDSDEAACDTEALNSESIPTDTDGDLVCDVLDTDDDGDGIPDGADSFPLDASETTDTDGDGTGNNADTDDDGDSWSDSDEAACDTEALNSESIPTDTDGDLVCDVLDTDDDGDGIPDGADSFPLDATETTDTDSDGVGDNSDNCVSDPNADQSNYDSDWEGDACDADDDNDGFTDAQETEAGSDPQDESSMPDLGYGLIAHYSFEGNADDESGNANHGVVSGPTLANDRFENTESAYDFDGHDDAISVASVISGHGEFTSVISFRPASDPLVEKRILQTANGGILYTSDRTLVFEIYEDRNGGANNPAGPSTRYLYEYPLAEAAEDWIHLAFVASSGNTGAVFIDGQEVLLDPRHTDGGVEGQYVATVVGATYDSRTNSLDGFFDGTIEGLRIYDRALSASEIASLYELSLIDLYANQQIDASVDFATNFFGRPETVIANPLAIELTEEWYGFLLGRTSAFEVELTLSGGTFLGIWPSIGPAGSDADIEVGDALGAGTELEWQLEFLEAESDLSRLIYRLTPGDPDDGDTWITSVVSAGTLFSLAAQSVMIDGLDQVLNEPGHSLFLQFDFVELGGSDPLRSVDAKIAEAIQGVHASGSHSVSDVAGDAGEPGEIQYISQPITLAPQGHCPGLPEGSLLDVLNFSSSNCSDENVFQFDSMNDTIHVRVAGAGLANLLDAPGSGVSVNTGPGCDPSTELAYVDRLEQQPYGNSSSSAYLEFNPPEAANVSFVVCLIRADDTVLPMPQEVPIFVSAAFDSIFLLPSEEEAARFTLMPRCFGDLNEDYRVNNADYELFENCFDCSNSECDRKCDFDLDGRVNEVDALAFFDSLGQVCTPPEPTVYPYAYTYMGSELMLFGSAPSGATLFAAVSACFLAMVIPRPRRR